MCEYAAGATLKEIQAFNSQGKQFFSTEMIKTNVNMLPICI
jgi:hypothetical protein